MSLFDTIADLGRSAVDLFSGSSVGASLARTALSAYAVSQVTKSIGRDNDAAQQARTPAPAKQDTGQAIQVIPDQNNRIPVLYGKSTVPGIIVDANISDNRTKMTYVFAISEKTGNLLSTGQPTQYSWLSVYVNDQRAVFKADGCTLDYTVDRNGVQDITMRDLVTIRMYAGNSFGNSQIPLTNGNPITATNAWDIVPGWTPMHVMNDLVMAIITVIYSSEKGLNGVPKMLFELSSSMTQPGDVLYDYATNTRYGAGIATGDIYSE